jgi:hypothetical protein
MKYAVEMGSVAMIYIPSFVKIVSGIRKLIVRIRRQHGDRISLLQESRLIIGERERTQKLRGFGPLANYADRATAASWRSSTNFCG